MNELERQEIRARYDYHAAESHAAQRYQAELAKWLLASLVLVNGGALVLLANTKNDVLIHSAAPAFLVGIVTAILSGFFGWLNAGIRDLLFDDYVQPESLRTGQIKTPDKSVTRKRQIIWTYIASIGVGLISLGSFVVGAILAL